MGFLQPFFQSRRDLCSSPFHIVGHLVESLAVIIILQLSEGLHCLVEIIVDNGKAVTAVLKRLPPWVTQILRIVHEIHALLQDLRTTHRRKAVQIESDDQIGIIGEEGRQLVVYILFHEVQLVELLELKLEVLVLIII